jgi:hypothetical protein
MSNNMECSGNRVGTRTLRSAQLLRLATVKLSRNGSALMILLSPGPARRAGIGCNRRAW